jgi:hypothetical protein
MQLQESVFNGCLDPKLVFYSDEARFTLNGYLKDRITVVGAQKILILFISSIASFKTQNYWVLDFVHCPVF